MLQGVCTSRLQAHIITLCQLRNISSLLIAALSINIPPAGARSTEKILPIDLLYALNSLLLDKNSRISRITHVGQLIQANVTDCMSLMDTADTALGICPPLPSFLRR